MDERFTGTGVALITPFKEDLSIDFDAYGRIVEYVIKEDVDFLVPLGSTGEAGLLNSHEQRKVLDFVIKQNNGRKPVLAGNFGGNNTHALCQKIMGYNFDGIDGILSSSPAYVKPSQEGIFQHYMSLAEYSPVPIMIYNVPGRTGSNISSATALRLAGQGNSFAGIKEASGDLSQATEIIKDRPDRFIVSSGDDPTALALISLGGNGVISVIANAFPGMFTRMTMAARENDLQTANELHRKLFDIHKWLYIEGNPVGIKAAMAALGYCERHVRLPLTPMSEENFQKLKQALEGIQ